MSRLKILLSVLLAGCLCATAAYAFSAPYVDKEKVRVATCSDQMACESAMQKAESKARAKVVSRAKAGCQRHARQIGFTSGKYQYVSPISRGPGMFNRSSRVYDFRFQVYCKFYNTPGATGLTPP